MNQTRRVNYLLATLLAASLATFGCSKSESSGSGGKSSEAAKAAMKMMGKDTNTVIGVSMVEIVGSDLYKQYKPMLEAQMKQKSGKGLDDFKATCGLDPLVDFKSVIVGAVFTSNGPKDKGAVVNVLGPEKAKLLECMKKISEKEDGSVTEEGEVAKLTDKEGKTQWVGWKGNTTVIVPNGSKADLEGALAGSGGVSGDVSSLLGSVDQTAGIWFASVPEGGMKAPIPGMPPVSMKGAFGSISLSSGVSINVGVRFNSADEAGKLKEQVDGMMDMVKGVAKTKGLGGVVENLKLSKDGADLKVSLKLSMDDIKKIAEAAAGGM